MDKPCIVFGGSYGGMLASWLRMKYPQTFQGAFASSAPILYFKDAPTAPEDEFGKIATDAFTAQSEKCSGTIKDGWTYIMDIRDNRPEDWDALSTVFNTCEKIKNKEDITMLYEHLMNGLLYMAMTNYPYQTSFLTKMPAWPVKVACTYFKDFEVATEENLKRT